MPAKREDAELDISAEIALSYSLPENASEVPPSSANIVAAHKQAWEISILDEDDEMRQVFVEPDPVQRILLDMEDAKISRLITQALGSVESEARRISLGTAIFLAYRDRRNLTSAAWEPLAQLASRVLEPRAMNATLQPGPAPGITAWIDQVGEGPELRARLERNYVLSGFPDLWINDNWENALKRFQSDLDQFGVQEANEQ